MKQKRFSIDLPIEDPDDILKVEDLKSCSKTPEQRKSEVISKMLTPASFLQKTLSDQTNRNLLPALDTKRTHTQHFYKQNSTSAQKPAFGEKKVKISKDRNRISFQDSITSQLRQPQVLNKKKNKLMQKVDQLKESNKFEKQQGFIANTEYLNTVIKQARTKNIINNFIKKIRKDKVQDLTLLDFPIEQQSQSCLLIKGFQIHDTVDQIMKIMQILITFLMIFLNSIQLVFSEALVEQFRIIRLCALAFYFFQLLVNMLTIKKVQGRRFEVLREIWVQLGYDKIIMDLLNLFVILIDVSIEDKAIAYIRLLIIIKLPQVLQTLQEVQIKLITKNQNDKYWSLVKIFLFNLCFAHVLAIVLTSMAGVNPLHNWMTQKNIQRAQWYEQYIWAYYWGTNIMLTVGFGDIAASNFKQAFCLIFIETFSCIVLAYNVNCVGQLIMNIKSKDEEKKKQVKIFKKITESSTVSNDLNWKITNHIEESINMKKNFDFQEEMKFIANLPKYLKYDFLKETNKTVFNQLPFFRFMMEKTVYNLAEKIEMLMSHPEQIIRNKTDDFNLWIMRSGQVGLINSKRGSEIHKQIIDIITMKDCKEPKILTLNFITKKQLPYEFKSLQYSSFYFMQFQKLISCLREVDSDFQYYSFMRDKLNNIPDQFQVAKCSICKDRFHYKCDCPAIHYFPNKDKIVYSHLRGVKTGKNRTRTYQVRHTFSVGAFEVYRYFKINKQSTNSQLSYTPSLLGVEMDKMKTQNAIEEEISSDIPSKILSAYFSNDNFKELKQFISGEMEKISLQSDELDPIWGLRSDLMMNYTKYFPKDNPSNIKSKIEAIKLKHKTYKHK